MYNKLSSLTAFAGGKHFPMIFLFLYIFAFLSEPPSLAIVKISSFFFKFRNNYLPCQIHPEKLDTTRRSPGNRNEARLKKTRGKFMSAIYQLWIWGVVMVIWRSFLRVLFPLSSFALARGAISLFREGFSNFFLFSGFSVLYGKARGKPMQN